MNLVARVIEAIGAMFARQPKPERRPTFKAVCPCCGYRTLERLAEWPDLCQWNICPVCFWEDDDWFTGGGANEPTLDGAKANFLKFGAMEEGAVKHVRPPRKDEYA